MAALAAAALILGSCATMPPQGLPPDRYLAALPQDRSAYVTLDMEQTRDLVAAVAGELGLAVPAQRMETGLRRADMVYAAVGGVDPEAGALCALVVGRFPTVGLGFALKARDGWKRVRGKPVRYVNGASGLQVAVLEPGVLALSDGDVDAIALGAQPRDPGIAWGPVLDLGQAADLVVYLPKPPAFLAELGGPAAASVRTLWLRVTRVAALEVPARTPLVADLGVQLSGEREARLFRPLLRLALPGLVRRSLGGAAALSDVGDESAGNRVVLTGIRLTLDEAIQVIRTLRPDDGATDG